MKNPQQIAVVDYLYFILFRMHERVTNTEIKLDILIQMAFEHILAERFKQSIQWTAKVTHISEYVLQN